MNEICERCDTSCFEWTVREARIEVGGIHRKPHLCESCTSEVETALRVALKAKVPTEAPR